MRFQQPLGQDNASLAAAMRGLIDDIARFLPTDAELPVFADDTAAAAGQLKVGQPYYTPEGVRRRRIA